MGVYDIRVVEDGNLRCSKCNVLKSEFDFHKSTYRKNTAGRTYHCKDCVSIKQGEYRLTEVGFKVQLWNNLKGNARRRGLEVLIGKEQIDIMYANQGGLCAVTGLQMQYTSGATSKNDYAVSVDRVDSSKGYTHYNVRLVCARVNILRQELTDEQMAFWCNMILKGITK